MQYFHAYPYQGINMIIHNSCYADEFFTLYEYVPLLPQDTGFKNCHPAVNKLGCGMTACSHFQVYGYNLFAKNRDVVIIWVYTHVAHVKRNVIMIDSFISEKVHTNCLLCGNKNPWSQRIKFYESKEGEVCGEFQANSKLQGYDGILHGGVITSLLDSAMTHCLFHRGIQAVTGDLYVRFLHSVPCDSFLNIRASILSAGSSLYKVRAELICKEQIMAKAEAKFVRRIK